MITSFCRNARIIFHFSLLDITTAGTKGFPYEYLHSIAHHFVLTKYLYKFERQINFKHVPP